MAPTTTATRSVVVGLLLALFSAGCLIAFSLIAGGADNPTGTSVAASRPDGDVPAVVLDARLSSAENESSDDSPSPQVTLTEVLQPLVVQDAVLGTRLRNEPTKSPDGHRKQDHERRKQNDRDGKKKKKKKKNDANRPDDRGSVTGGHVTARPAASTGCECKGKTTKTKTKSDHSPNGHAYGHNKQAPAGSGSQGLARGHDKGNGHSQGKGKDK